jgi:hypothetical protein
VHGWDSSGGGVSAALWEALPWSWFIDYFGNIGDYLNANKNAVGASATNACYMRQIDKEWSYGPFDISYATGFTCKAGSYKETTKERFLGLATLTASMPMLSHKQLSTLSSIAFNLSRKQ